MGFKSDIEIAQEATMMPIMEVAKNIGITEDDKLSFTENIRQKSI